MHRLPKFFSHSSERRKGPMGSSSSYGGSSSRGASKQKRLDRRNAVKNINYDFSPSTSASSSSHVSEESLRRRSADLYGDKSSFRVDGTNGEFEMICKTFGFSGIDDFQISPEEYESMKVRSSSTPVEFSRVLGPILYQEPKISDNIRDVVSEKVEDSCDIGHIDRNRVNVISTSVGEPSKEFGDAVRVSESGRSSELRGNGIKGVRPPALEPPTLMMDKDCSTWNTSREFVLDTDTRVSNLGRGFCVDDEDGRDRSKQGDMRRMIRADNRGLLEPFYFSTTSNDDDSSSTTTEPATSISPNAKFRRGIKDWQKGERLGGGSFGSVYEGIADDGFFFAVKEVSLLDQGDEGKQCIIQLEQEIALLSQFQHENIVQYYGTKKDESHLYIFLEFVTKGSLSSLYQKYDMRVLQASGYTRQILRGLKYLHDRNVVHRDIKCANILVHTNGSVKLADFGLAKATKLNDLKSCKGTAFWMAPEVVRNQWYGLAADIWSLGCTVLEMLTKRFPYANLERGAAIYKIGKGEKPPIPDSLSSDARDFILQCLQVDPSSRPTAAQLLDHPFVKKSLPSSSGRASSPQNFGGPI